uniref:Uncharacterized protein n=1 Tax=Trypanosoma congolense (strain IL3000) TaxID=1068625 RepID=G0URN1_TRYCI|nr:hypothetical protein, unlikely [Trypanosoma congolense IL3000]
MFENAGGLQYNFCVLFFPLQQFQISSIDRRDVGTVEILMRFSKELSEEWCDRVPVREILCDEERREEPFKFLQMFTHDYQLPVRLYTLTKRKLFLLCFFHYSYLVSPSMIAHSSSFSFSFLLFF